MEQRCHSCFRTERCRTTRFKLATFGRLLDGYKDDLPRFERVAVRIDDPRVIVATGRADHASVTFNGNLESHVSGTVFEITDDELALADRYEDLASYKRISATLASGKTAWLYVDGRS
jgi:gamma-glutamyl AIG2-like cyclotransferase